MEANFCQLASLPSQQLVQPSQPPRVRDPNPIITYDLISSLELAPTTADRLTLLYKADLTGSYFKYNFNLDTNPSPGGGTGLGGSGVLANRKNFPALISLGVAASVGFLNLCGMNTPHTHCRATVPITSGGNVKSSFIQENGETTEIATVLNRYEGGILPMGSIHYNFNDSCDPAVFIVAFSDQGPGLSRIAQDFFWPESGYCRSIY